MRHPGLTVGAWVLFAMLVGVGVAAGFLFTDDKSGSVPVGVLVLVFSIAVGLLCSLVASDMGSGEVVTIFPGQGNHDLIFGGTYRVLSSRKWANRTNTISGYAVVLEDTDGNLWSCVLPEEPPAHFVYTRGEKKFVPYATTTPAPAFTAPTTDEETAAASTVTG